MNCDRLYEANHRIAICMYGFDYRKPTRFWTNINGMEIKICNHKKHKLALGHLNHGTTLLQQYRIPEKLCDELINKTI